MNNITICQSCLSIERKLFCVQKLKCLLNNEDLFNLNIGGVCWECKSLLLKISRFRKQVVTAQKILESGKANTLKCSSNLSFSPTQTYSSQDTGSLHSVIIETEPAHREVKVEIIKEELDLHESHADDNDVYVLLNEEEKEIEEEKPTKKIPKVKRNVKKKKKIKHIKVESNDYDIVKEKFVEVEFTEEEMLRNREEKRNHPNYKKLPYKCDTCVLGFTKKENLDVHLQKKHNKRVGKHVCTVCNTHLTSSVTLARHVKKHYHCYRCKMCTYETTELWYALSHCLSKHTKDSEDAIHCTQCSYVAKTREEMADHSKTEHALICPECGEKFSSTNTFKSHMRRIHGTPTGHTCELCRKTLRTRGRLEAHMARHGAGALLSYCATCRIQYKNIYVYRNHLRTSSKHSETRYPCGVCSKKFTSKVYLKRHYSFYHQNTSPFKCEQCDLLFISEWKLRRHRQLHHGLARSRDHTCNICDKKFFDTSTLKAHKLTHSAQRSYMCEDCGATFKQRPALHNHARLLHKGLQRTSL